MIKLTKMKEQWFLRRRSIITLISERFQQKYRSSLENQEKHETKTKQKK